MVICNNVLGIILSGEEGLAYLGFLLYFSHARVGILINGSLQCGDFTTNRRGLTF